MARVDDGRRRSLPPPGVRSIPAEPDGATRVVLVRHGEAVCNVAGVVGGRTGCSGLTDQGRRQAGALGARLAATGELAEVGALYASVLPRAIETARLIAPGLAPAGVRPELATDCAFCELHPGEADGLDWATYTERYGDPDWNADPDVPLAPGAESWSAFVERASGAVAAAAAAHPGQLVVIVCHAGVIEATLLAFLPLDRARVGRGWIQTDHASMTEWRLAEDHWMLRRYNDVTPVGDAQQA